MSRWLLGLLVAILLVLFGIEFPYLIGIISTKFVDMHWCDIAGNACNAASAGVLIVSTIVIIGLFIIIAVGLEKRWSKTHGLEIFYDNNNRRCHHFNEKSVEGKDAYFTCPIITNKSKIPAENCNGRLAIIKDRNGVKCLDWFSSDLGWDRQTKVAPVRLDSNGGNKPLDVGWVNKGEDIFKIRTDQSTQGVITHRPRGTYYFLIVVSADGVNNTARQWFRVDWYGDFSDFKMKQVRGIQISIPFLRHRLDRAHQIIEENKVKHSLPPASA